MGLVSDRKRPRKSDLLRAGVGIGDVFESKASYHVNYPEGIVVVLDGFAYRTPRVLIGKDVRIERSGSPTIRATIADVRNHGSTISLFFDGLKREVVPVGAMVYLED